jgi:hypothetical protein
VQILAVIVPSSRAAARNAAPNRTGPRDAIAADRFRFGSEAFSFALKTSGFVSIILSSFLLSSRGRLTFRGDSIKVRLAETTGLRLLHLNRIA